MNQLVNEMGYTYITRIADLVGNLQTIKVLCVELQNNEPVKAWARDIEIIIHDDLWRTHIPLDIFKI